MAQFKSFPTEILLLIAELADPWAILNVASTCKPCYNVYLHILRRHENAYHKYRVISDISPATVPFLLKDVARDGIDAWHVRSFENWGLRRSWNDWTEYTITQHRPPGYSTRKAAPVQKSFSSDDLDIYLNLLATEIPFVEEEFKMAARDLKLGNDGILKALLIAMCPRLNTIKFVRGMDDVDFNSCLTWLTRIIEACSSERSEKSNQYPGEYRWPSGFENLNEIAIGVNSGTWLDSIPSSCHPYYACAIMKLPALKSLYLQGFYDNAEILSDDYTDEVWDISSREFPSRSSSVEHIFLDDCPDLDLHYLLAACRTLPSLCLRDKYYDGWFREVKTIAERAPAVQPQFQNLMLYGPNQLLYGYRYVPPPTGKENDGHYNQSLVTIDSGSLMVSYRFDFPLGDGVDHDCYLSMDDLLTRQREKHLRQLQAAACRMKSRVFTSQGYYPYPIIMALPDGRCIIQRIGRQRGM